MNVSNKEFLQTLFHAAGEEDKVWTNHSTIDPDTGEVKWGGRGSPISKVRDLPDQNAWFAMGIYPKDAKSRKMEVAKSVAVLMLDDIKASDLPNLPLEPTAAVETSKDNFQIFYSFTEPLSIAQGQRFYDEITKRAGKTKANDKNGNNPVRYGRLPNGTNKKGDKNFRHQLHTFDKNNIYTPEQVIDGLKLDREYVVNGRPQENASDRARDFEHFGEYQSSEELWKEIAEGVGFHDQILKITARMVADGMRREAIIGYCQDRMNAIPQENRRGKWKADYEYLGHAVDGAFANGYNKNKDKESKFADPKTGKLDADAVYAAFQPKPYSFDVPFPIKYLLKGLIEEGIISLAGAGGAGKTTALVEIASIVAHLCDESKLQEDQIDDFLLDDDMYTVEMVNGKRVVKVLPHFLKVKGRRKVIHFSEHVEQIHRCLFAKRRFGVNHSAITCSVEEGNEWYMTVPTAKLSKDEIAILIERYARDKINYFDTEKLDESGNKVVIALSPLILFDTVSASFDVEDENSNAELSKYVAAINQARWELSPSIVLVTHVSKGSKDQDATDQSSRGGGSQDNNTHTNIGLAREGDVTVISVTKNRAPADFDELYFHPKFDHLDVVDEYGEFQHNKYVTGRITRGKSADRKAKKRESAREAKEAAKPAILAQRAQVLIDQLKAAPQDQFFNKKSLVILAGGNGDETRHLLNLLTTQGFLVSRNLTAEEKVLCGNTASVTWYATTKPLDQFKVVL